MLTKEQWVARELARAPKTMTEQQKATVRRIAMAYRAQQLRKAKARASGDKNAGNPRAD